MEIRIISLVRVIGVVAIITGQLGLVHCLVGLVHELVGIDVSRLRVESQANACRGVKPELAELRGLGCRGEQASKHWHTRIQVRQVEQDRNELVTPDAGDGVAFARSVGRICEIS